MPVDGTGPCEWEGFLPVGEIPHVKNRARGLAEVVDTCFAIGRPELALAYAERIAR